MPKKLVMDDWQTIKQWLAPRLQKKEITTLSIALFDTLLVRLATPEVVKQSYAHALAYHASDSRDFICQTLQLVETTLQQKSYSVGLDRTYRLSDWTEQLEKKISLNSDLVVTTDQLMVEVEQAACYLPFETFEFLLWLMKQNVQVVLVSDTYLDYEHVQQLLNYKDIPAFFNDMYLASDTLQTKRSGRLFQNIAAELAVPLKQWVHIGSDQQADVKSPKELGIHTIYFRANQHIKQAQALNLAYKQAQKSISNLDKGQYFFTLLDTYRQGLETTTGNDLVEDIDRELAQAMCCIFVCALQERLQKRAVDCVFFMSSDGLLFRQMMEDTLSQQVHDVLYISQQIVDIASLQNDVDAGVIQTLSEKYQCQATLKSLCDLFGFPYGQLKHLAWRHGIPEAMSLSDKRNQRVTNFWQDADVSIIVASFITKQRDALYAYLLQVGFFKYQQVVFVGLGCELELQNQLQQLFADKKLPAIQGYYLAMDEPTLDTITNAQVVLTHPTVTGYRYNQSWYEPVIRFDTHKVTRNALETIRHETLTYWTCFQDILRLTTYNSDDLLPYIQARLRSDQKSHPLATWRPIDGQNTASLTRYIKATIRQLVVR